MVLSNLQCTPPLCYSGWPSLKHLQQTWITKYHVGVLTNGSNGPTVDAGITIFLTPLPELVWTTHHFTEIKHYPCPTWMEQCKHIQTTYEPSSLHKHITDFTWPNSTTLLSSIIAFLVLLQRKRKWNYNWRPKDVKRCNFYTNGAVRSKRFVHCCTINTRYTA